MRKIYLILLIVAINITSCSKDNNTIEGGTYFQFLETLKVDISPEGGSKTIKSSGFPSIYYIESVIGNDTIKSNIDIQENGQTIYGEWYTISTLRGISDQHPSTIEITLSTNSQNISRVLIIGAGYGNCGNILTISQSNQ